MYDGNLSAKNVTTRPLDHLGIVASVILDLRIN